MENEVWKDIPEYIGHYQVSNFGRVKSLDRMVFFRKTEKSLQTKKLRKGVALRAAISNSGYETVCLKINGKRKNYSVHRLVALAFLGKSSLEVNHIDGKKNNNSVSNLQYCTRSENEKHAWKTGLKKMRDVRGEKHPNAILNSVKVEEIRNRKPKNIEEFKLIANEFKITRAHLRAVLLRKIWR